jgi:hypothetical protein
LKVDIKILETAISEIEKNVKVLENSKFEDERELIVNGANVKFTLKKCDLENLCCEKKISSVEKYATSDKFSKLVKVIKIKGGFVILK